MARVIPLLLFHRIAFWLNRNGAKRAAKVVASLARYLCAGYIGPGAIIGKNVSLGYGGLNVIIHGDVSIGDYVQVGSGVTIGGRSKIAKVPIVENYCVIGSGAKILGPVRVGEGSVVGANAVVIRDVPPHAVVAGIPAKVVKMDVDCRDYNNLL